MAGMRLFLLTALTMIAFAANSVLNRMALADGMTDPASFALIRVLSGAAVLGVLVWMRDRKITLRLVGRSWQVIGLTLYLICFSLAYLHLDAGVGALILFGGVQVTMFASAILSGEPMPARRIIGAGLALAGLGIVLWPSGEMGLGDLRFGAIMLVAALGWGIYSIVGRAAMDPLGDTAMNFIFAAPICALFWVFFANGFASQQGIVLACVSGVITSGLGYALWYRVLPQIQASVAAVAQLSVPIIALLGGMIFLGEGADMQFILGTGLVLGGMALALARRSN